MFAAVQHDLAGGDVGTREGNVRARCDGTAHDHFGAFHIRMFDHHHCIRTARQHPARGDRHGASCMDSRFWYDRGGNIFGEQNEPSRQLLARTESVCRLNRVSIDVGTVERRDINGRSNIARQDSA
jgi:hypothetical protein